MSRHENLLNTVVVLPELKPDRIRIAPDAAVAEGVEVSLKLRRRRRFSAGSPTRIRGCATAWTANGRLPQLGPARLRDGGPCLERRPLGSLARDHLARGWPTTEVELLTLEPFPLVETGKRNAENVSNYWRIDARVARRFDLDSAGELTVFVEVSNLTKRNNDCCVEYQLEDEEEDEVFLDVEARGIAAADPVRRRPVALLTEGTLTFRKR